MAYTWFGNLGVQHRRRGGFCSPAVVPMTLLGAHVVKKRLQTPQEKTLKPCSVSKHHEEPLANLWDETRIILSKRRVHSQLEIPRNESMNMHELNHLKIN